MFAWSKPPAPTCSRCPAKRERRGRRPEDLGAARTWSRCHTIRSPAPSGCNWSTSPRAAWAAGAAALPAVTALAPAGIDEVSAQAAVAFAEQGAALLAVHAAAQEELARTGVTLTDIARMYAEVDGEAAGTLEMAGGQFVGQPFTASTGLARGEALPGAGGSAARTPLPAGLLDSAPTPPAPSPPTPATGAPSAALPGVVNAASTALGAGAGPLGSLAQSASAGGSAGPGLASSSPTSRGRPSRSASWTAESPASGCSSRRRPGSAAHSPGWSSMMPSQI